MKHVSKIDFDSTKVYKVKDAYICRGAHGIGSGASDRPEYVGTTGTVYELQSLALSLASDGIIIDVICRSEGWRTGVGRRAKHLYFEVVPA